MDVLTYAKIGEAIVVILSISTVGLMLQTIRTYKENNEALKQRVEVVEAETKACHDQHQENVKQIKKLEGKIETYSELVLIPEKFMQEIQDNQKEIIKLLKK